METLHLKILTIKSVKVSFFVSFLETNPYIFGNFLETFKIGVFKC